jgi:hypothetical protein
MRRAYRRCLSGLGKYNLERSRNVEKSIDYYMSLPYTVKLEPDGKGYRASVEELPGARITSRNWSAIGTACLRATPTSCPKRSTLSRRRSAAGRIE